MDLFKIWCCFYLVTSYIMTWCYSESFSWAKQIWKGNIYINKTYLTCITWNFEWDIWEMFFFFPPKMLLTAKCEYDNRSSFLYGSIYFWVTGYSTNHDLTLFLLILLNNFLDKWIEFLPKQNSLSSYTRVTEIFRFTIVILDSLKALTQGFLCVFLNWRIIWMCNVASYLICIWCSPDRFCFVDLNGYCTPGPYFWRLSVFSPKYKASLEKYPMDLQRNVQRN